MALKYFDSGIFAGVAKDSNIRFKNKRTVSVFAMYETEMNDANYQSNTLDGMNEITDIQQMNISSKTHEIEPGYIFTAYPYYIEIENRIYKPTNLGLIVDFNLNDFELVESEVINYDYIFAEIEKMLDDYIEAYQNLLKAFRRAYDIVNSITDISAVNEINYQAAKLNRKKVVDVITSNLFSDLNDSYLNFNTYIQSLKQIPGTAEFIQAIPANETNFTNLDHLQAERLFAFMGLFQGYNTFYSNKLEFPIIGFKIKNPTDFLNSNINHSLQADLCLKETKYLVDKITTIYPGNTGNYNSETLNNGSIDKTTDKPGALLDIENQNTDSDNNTERNENGTDNHTPNSGAGNDSEQKSVLPKLAVATLAVSILRLIFGK